MLKKTLAALSLCATLLCAAAAAQECSPPAIVANAKSSNILTPEQETIFGELSVQSMAGDTRFVRDERLVAYVNYIGERLAKHLPQTGLKFRFYIVDLHDANAFNIPGGYVFVSRKLIGFANNEDELAGVIAHELGHAVVHHSAAIVSLELKKILNVTSLGDRKDVTEKYNLLIERARTKNISFGQAHELAQEVEADKLAVFAMAAAGYDPSAVSSFFGRLTETKAKGGWLSGLFSSPLPEQKILREAAHAADRLPAACREAAPGRTAEEFLRWQADVVSFREAGRKEELPGLLWKKELSPKLRSDVSHFAFSRDGRLLLAQDDFSVTVIAREDQPRVLFQIPAEDADEAAFTPDGKYVVFTTENLRYEKWSVADAAPVEVRELVLRRDCWEHNLSPDGNYLACVDTSTTINVLDVRTGNKVWEKKEFYALSLFELIPWLASAGRGDEGGYGVGFFRIEFSPDSRYVMFSRSQRFRFRINIDGLTAAASENTAVALDLTTLKPVEVGGDMRKVASRPYAFLESGAVVGMPGGKTAEAGVFSFPSGKRLQKFELGALAIKPTANPDYVVIKPLANAKLGVFSIREGRIVSGLDKEDATLWGNLLAYESLDGKVLLREVSYNEAEKRFDGKDAGSVEIPVSAVKGLEAADVSNNFQWLLMSSKTRGGLWSLASGERKAYVRSFRGAVAADDGGAVGDFPKAGEAEHNLVLMNGKNGSIFALRALPEKGARQHGRFVLTRTSMKEGGEKAGKGTLLAALTGEEPDDLDLRRDVHFELRDLVSDKVIWSRDFQKDAPEYSFDEFSGRLIFYWRLGGEAGKARLKESTELKAKADALGNKDDDYLVEVVDAFAQKTVGTMLLETGKGSFAVGEGLSEGDWLVLHDSEGRLLIYSIKDGDLRHRFFGATAAINPGRNQVAVENFPGEVSLYDLNTGERKANFRINGSAAFVRFNLGGDRLFVLSDAQTAYAFNLDGLVAGAAPTQAK